MNVLLSLALAFLVTAGSAFAASPQDILTLKANGNFSAYNSAGTLILQRNASSVSGVQLSAGIIAFNENGTFYVYNSSGILIAWFSSSSVRKVALSINVIALNTSNGFYVYNSAGNLIISGTATDSGINASADIVTYTDSTDIFVYNSSGTLIIRRNLSVISNVKVGDGIISFNESGSFFAFNSSGLLFAQEFASSVTEPRIATEKPPVAPPPAPANLILESATTSGFSARWTSQGSTTAGFIINKATGNVPSLTCQGGIDVGMATSYSFTSLTAATLYTVSICARNSEGAVSVSTVKTISTLTPATPPAPTALVIASSTSTSLSINWQSSAGTTTGFLVKVVSGNIPATTCAGGVNVGNVTSYLASGLSPNTTYTVAVCAYNSVSAQSTSITAISSTLNSPPPPPTGLRTTSLSTTFVGLSWTSGGGNTTGYFVTKAVGSVATSCNAGVDIGNTTSYTFSGLSRATTYTFAVCAYESSKKSFSTPARITVTTRLF